MGSRPSKLQSVVNGILVGVLGCAILFRGLLGHDVSSTLWADDYDARLLHWIAAWGYHALVEGGSLSQFWNAPAFYPHSHTLAFSDSLISAQLFYTPLRLAGIGEFPSLYLTLALGSISACVLSSIALSRITGFTALEQALIIYASHFGLNIIGYLPHYQLFGFQFAFPYFLYLYLTLRDAQRFDLYACVVCFCLAVGFATYLGPMLATITAFLFVFTFLKPFRDRTFRGCIRKLGWPSLAVAAGMLALLFCVQLLPYLRVSSLMQPASIHEAAQYSARPFSLLAPVQGGNSLWYSPRAVAQFGDAERAFFPGFLITYSMVLFLFLKAGVNWRMIDLRTPLAAGLPPGLVRYMVALLVCSFVLALGPYIPPYSWLALPYQILSWIVPGLERVRAPGRFGIFIGLPAACLAVGLIRSLAVSEPSRRKIAALFAFLVLVESLPFYRTFAFEQDAKGAYRMLRNVMPPNSPLVELPVAGGDALRTLRRVTEQLHGTLIHQGKVMVGYGATSTAEAQALSVLDLQLQRGKSRPHDIVAFADRFEIRWFLIHLDRYTPQLRKRWRRYVRDNTGVKVIYQDSRSLIFQVTS